jgi:hypothetical protein
VVPVGFVKNQEVEIAAFLASQAKERKIGEDKEGQQKLLAQFPALHQSA